MVWIRFGLKRISLDTVWIWFGYGLDMVCIRFTWFIVESEFGPFRALILPLPADGPEP